MPTSNSAAPTARVIVVCSMHFSLSPRHQTMFLEGLDLIDAGLGQCTGRATRRSASDAYSRQRRPRGWAECCGAVAASSGGHGHGFRIASVVFLVMAMLLTPSLIDTAEGLGIYRGKARLACLGEGQLAWQFNTWLVYGRSLTICCWR
jgi:hypothetical protein